MLGQFFTDTTAPFTKSLENAATSKGLTDKHLTISAWLSGIATLVTFGLQYFATGVVFFLVHKTIISMLETKSDENKTGLFQTYFVTTGSMIAMLWTASDSSLPIAFMFWAIMMNLTATISFKPNFVIIDSFEIACVAILFALAPTYTPAIAILFGAACLVSLCASYLQTFRNNL